MPTPPRYWKELSFKQEEGIINSGNDTKSGRNDNNFHERAISFDSNINECYACTQVGVPVFHSTRWDLSHQPQWEASAGSCLRPVQAQPRSRNRASNWARAARAGVVDPRSKSVKRWNRVVLLARGTALAVDPLFLYVMSLSAGGDPCFYLDVALAVVVTVVRTCLDAVHLAYLWLQFRLAYVSSESMVVGCGKLVWDTRAIASHYIRSFKGFWLDAFVILPIPQAVIWLIVPRLLGEGRITVIMTILLLSFLFQFLPKVYHSLYLMRRLQKVTGYVFGSVWWRFILNVIAYLIASHVAGACWYILGTERLMGCLEQQCERSKNCNLSVYYSQDHHLVSRGNVTTISSKCLDVDGPFNYGIYTPVLYVYSSNSLAVKILYPVFWGLLNLSSFGNELDPTSNWLELIYSCCITIAGLVLFVTLIGNIQVFLHMVMANKKKMQLQYQDLEWWMKRRQLPSHLRERVRHFQRQSWASMGGQDEMELMQHFPDGLRRDIRRYLCIELVMKVPLFHLLDDLILDNICDRLRPLVYSKGEKIVREGDPIQRMVFVVRGRLNRSQGLSKGFLATSALESGGFFGDELLSWCLRRPFVNRLPASSATFTCVEPIEAFGINADDLRYIISHFRYRFASEKLKRTARYYSSNWRTWGAIVIQLGWRRYRMRTRGVPAATLGGGTANRLRQYAALFLSLRPHDHLE
ncbi:Voltage dependent potassium channel [Parasponia andersonii]|uniref:Voltage dependent potassium channel n=1 Tax=Parasponia andersonii TaxID=3476 RepID=A0A2P5CG62_PARAD|nr:Voltage dependent potassium channel [Parasponia andersonii]